MESLLKLLISVLYFNVSFGYVIESDEPGSSLLWPTEYYFRAEKLDLKTGIVEPYEVWYSAEQNKSRIDYYNGMVKRYYSDIDVEEDCATVYQVYPMTTDDVTNEIVCKKMEYEETVDYLPNSEDFTHQGEQTIDGKIVQVWKNIEDDEFTYKDEEVLYVYRDVGGTDIPVRYEWTRYSSWNNGLTERAITNYYTFKTSISSDDVDAEELEECSDEGKLGENFRIDIEFLHPGIPKDVDKAFHSFKKHYNKKHNKNEHEMRKAIFEENWRHVINHNKKNLGYKLEVNQFADHTDEELSYLTGTRSSGPQSMGSVPFPYSEEQLQKLEKELPLNYDMRVEGVISPVKNQGECGSCWAFSSTAAVEGALARSNGGRNIDLSEQSLVDCAWSSNYGCDGGVMEGAFKYISAHGIPSQREYGPYLQQDGYCNAENMTQLYSIKGFARVPSLSETAFKAALFKYGPVAVSIEATRNMMFYSSGVFYDAECDAGSVNHGVTVVGYGVRDGTSYWIVKNSWGEDWGEDGYVLMSAVNNNCNVMLEGFYPIV